MRIRDLTIEFEQLESAESVDSAQTATTTSHKAWLDEESVDVSVQENVSVQRSLSTLFSSSRAQKAKLENEKVTKSNKAFRVYYWKGEQEKSDQQVNLIQFF
jgi:hypothetical protein